MNRNASKNFVIVGLAVMVVSVLLFAGCSTSPVANLDENQPQLLRRSADAVSAAQLSPIPLEIAQVIPAKTGGRLQLFDVILDIPAGAVDNDTLFSIVIPDLNVFYNEFGTHGLQFNVPVTITMSYRDADLSGVDETSIRIAWWDPVDQHFEDIRCSVDHVTKTVTGSVNHFSAYALISD